MPTHFCDAYPHRYPMASFRAILCGFDRCFLEIRFGIIQTSMHSVWVGYAKIIATICLEKFLKLNLECVYRYFCPKQCLCIKNVAMKTRFETAITFISETSTGQDFLSCPSSRAPVLQDRTKIKVASCRTGQDVPQDKYNNFSSFQLNDICIKFCQSSYDQFIL